MPQSRTETDARYNRSPKGQARRARYCQSEKGKVRLEEFRAKHGGQAAYERERYHKIQEEAGCHMRPREFLPGYRLIKALETAEVVEV